MGKIYYKMDGHSCLTPCPKKEIMVNSNACKYRCGNADHLGEDKKGEYVECKLMEGEKAPIPQCHKELVEKIEAFISGGYFDQGIVYELEPILIELENIWENNYERNKNI